MHRKRPSIARLRELFEVRDDGALIRRVRVKSHKAGVECRTRHQGYVRVCVDQKNFMVHQVVWAIVHGEWPDGHIDHVNGVRCDNRPSNLRIASNSQNQRNRGPTRLNLCGLKGVSKRTGNNKFVARITHHGKTITLGPFDSAENAHAVYWLAAQYLHGEFARAA